MEVKESHSRPRRVQASRARLKRLRLMQETSSVSTEELNAQNSKIFKCLPLLNVTQRNTLPA